MQFAVQFASAILVKNTDVGFTLLDNDVKNCQLTMGQVSVSRIRLRLRIPASSFAAGAIADEYLTPLTSSRVQMKLNGLAN